MAGVQFTMSNFAFVARAPDGKELQSSVIPFPVLQPAGKPEKGEAKTSQPAS